MTDRFEGRLSEFLDGELTPEESALVERHVADCESCARVLNELEAVTLQARELPARQPAADLWTGIAARIAQPAADVTPLERPRAFGRRVSVSVPQLAAAAVILASLSAGGAWIAGRGGLAPGLDSGSTPSAVTVDARPAAPGARAVSTDAETLAPAEYYTASIEALESLLFDTDRPLPAETEARIRRALIIIDGAIDDARAALAEMPDDTHLRERVTNTLRRKSEFLRGAVRQVAQS